MGGWSILYASTGEADDAYVFYSGDPMRHIYVTLRGRVWLLKMKKWEFAEDLEKCAGNLPYSRELLRMSRASAIWSAITEALLEQKTRALDHSGWTVEWQLASI